MQFAQRQVFALAALLTSLAASAAAPTEVPQSVVKVAQANITRDTLRAPIRILASDEFEGRGPATRGDALARLYLATELETLGLKPGGENGGWEQSFDIVGVKAKLPASWDFTSQAKGGGKVSLGLSDDYIASSGVQSETAGFKDAGVVFVGYGIQAPPHLQRQQHVLLHHVDVEPGLFRHAQHEGPAVLQHRGSHRAVSQHLDCGFAGDAALLGQQHAFGG